MKIVINLNSKPSKKITINQKVYTLLKWITFVRLLQKKMNCKIDNIKLELRNLSMEDIIVVVFWRQRVMMMNQIL